MTENAIANGRQIFPVGHPVGWIRTKLRIIRFGESAFNILEKPFESLIWEWIGNWFQASNVGHNGVKVFLVHMSVARIGHDGKQWLPVPADSFNDGPDQLAIGPLTKGGGGDIAGIEIIAADEAQTFREMVTASAPRAGFGDPTCEVIPIQARMAMSAGCHVSGNIFAADNPLRSVLDGHFRRGANLQRGECITADN